MNSDHDIESTEHLLQELKKIKLNPKALHAFQEQYTPHHSFQSLSDYLNYYIAEHPNLETRKIYIDADIQPSYGNQIFNGTKKRPGKYKLIPICIAMGMNLTETNRALRLAKAPELDPRNKQDMALIICINEKVGTIYNVNEFLAAAELPPPWNLKS